tara:strand:- start:677 stop:1015 length:339 start_codon:yes stop_codon:yes gene_type:complete
VYFFEGSPKVFPSYCANDLEGWAALFLQETFLPPSGAKKRKQANTREILAKFVYVCYIMFTKEIEMHYIEVYDEDYNLVTKYSFFAKEISKVFAKIKTLNLERKKFKHYFVD